MAVYTDSPDLSGFATVAQLGVAVGDKVTVTVHEAALLLKVDATALTAALLLKAAAVHGHAISEVTGLAAEITRLDGDISGKAPTAHNHTMGNVTGLAAEIARIDQDIATLTGVDLTAINAAIALKADDTAVNTALALKADDAAVNTALALKADDAAVNTSLALKADDAAVNTALALKANDAAVNTALALKVDQATYDAAIASLAALNHGHTIGDITGLQTALNSITALANGTDQMIFALVNVANFQILHLHELLVDTTASRTLIAPANPIEGQTYFNIADGDGTAADNPPTIDWGTKTHNGDTTTILDINNFSFRFRFVGGVWRAY